MSKELALLGVPALLTIAYIVYCIIIGKQPDKYKITGEKKRKSKKKRIPLIALLLVNGVYILVMSFLVYKPQLMVMAKSFHYAPTKELTFDDILDKGMKLIGFLSAAGGAILTFKEIFNKSKE